MVVSFFGMLGYFILPILLAVVVSLVIGGLDSPVRNRTHLETRNIRFKDMYVLSFPVNIEFIYFFH